MTGSMSQSIHASTPSRSGEPEPAGFQPRPANLSSPFEAKRRQTSSWSSARMFTQNAPGRLDLRPRRRALAGRRTPTSGGSSDTEQNEPTARPTGRAVGRGGDDGDAGREVAEHLAVTGASSRSVGWRRLDRPVATRYGADGRRRERRRRREALVRPRGPRRCRCRSASARASARIASTASSSWVGVVVEQREPAGAGLAGDVHRVVDGAVAPVDFCGELVDACTARRGSGGRRRRTARAPRRRPSWLPSSGIWWSVR